MTVQELPTYWQNLCARYGIDEKHTSDFWNEIEKAYSAKARHYHTLDHVAFILSRLEERKPLKYIDELAFATFYHDIVYYVLHSNNEKKSAERAEKRLRRFDFSPESLELIQRAIRSTKGHQKQEEEEVNLFLDLDICILGADDDRYDRYTERVRYEYAIIPDAIFNNGRKKVLRYFLGKKKIYHTQSCQEMWEAKARANLSRELEMLNS